MISEFINVEELAEMLIPSEKDINRVIRKLEKNKELDFYDSIILSKLELCHRISIKSNTIQKEREGE